MNTPSKCQVPLAEAAVVAVFREFGTELQAPEPDAFVGHQDPAFGQNQLDITQAQAEHMMQPYCVTDDLRWKPMPGVGGRIVHQASVACLPS